jgi:hypothetical protein
MKTIEDKAIDEIRQIRHHLSEECGHDSQRLLEYMKKQEKDFQEQIIKYITIQNNDVRSESSNKAA